MSFYNKMKYIFVYIMMFIVYIKYVLKKLKNKLILEMVKVILT